MSDPDRDTYVEAIAFRGREEGRRPELGGDLMNAMTRGRGGSNKPHVLVSETLSSNPRNRSASVGPIAFNSGGGAAKELSITEDGAPPMTVGDTVSVLRMREGKEGGGKGPLLSEGASLTLARANDQTVFAPASVRRLTATECERLQAFPDGWTCLCGCEPYSTGACTCPDGPRYAAMGNAVTVSVAYRALALVDAVLVVPRGAVGEDGSPR